MEAARRTGPALEAMNSVVFVAGADVERFPRSQKFLLGTTAGHGARRAGAAD